MTLLRNLQEMERAREAYWLRYPRTSPVKLRWRAATVRHILHTLPGESILELGAGTGLWTQHLAGVLKGENAISAAVFNHDFARRAEERGMPNTRVQHVHDLSAITEQYDYVVGTAILCHDRYPENLELIYRCLKPGGRMVFFEANYWNPQVFVKSTLSPVGRWAGQASCQVALRRYRLAMITSEKGFVAVDTVPYDIVHARTPSSLLGAVQAAGYLLEHLPGVREICGTLLISAQRPGGAGRPAVNLASHPEFENAVSVVLPCHNEAMNVGRMVSALTAMYDRYIAEILVVDDNSTDSTATVASALAEADPRIRVLRRSPPRGVGRALRDAYASVSGRYVLSLDCDFFELIPELRDLFDAAASGHDGAMGSRFSRESVVLNYPPAKILGNRTFHLLLRPTLGISVRDVSNNLKLLPAEAIKALVIEEGGFAANAETGLKPLLAGYDVAEVPVSWIGRRTDMGSSTFRTASVAPGYFRVLCRLAWRNRQRRHRRVDPPAAQPREAFTATVATIAGSQPDGKATRSAGGPREGSPAPR